MNISEFDELIKEFEVLPQPVSETTFMNICKHSRSRFEEICSRILAFYLQPLNEHGLNDLVLSSLFEIIDDSDFKFYDEKIFVETEAYIDGKYLDILVTGDSFALGIENKIGAEVYNPLNIYKKLIHQRHNNNYKVVLSERKIDKEREIKNIDKNGFIIVYYFDLFQIVKKNFGNYYSSANSKYVTFLFDFINTIENMSKSTIVDDPQSIFFFDNSKKLEKLITQFNIHKNRVLDIQKSNIVTLKEEISQKTGVKWWAWKDWDLGYSEFDKNKPRIGIESNYETSNYDTLKKFQISITTWNLKDWSFYEDDVLKKFNIEKYKPDKSTRNRVYLHIDVIEDNNQELIVKKLYEYYIFLKEIVESKK